ncbi:hypothetical protein PCYB_006410, partial [Plasmodium cynomolgi strain B]
MDRCTILYYWIYNSVKEHKIKNNIITESFYDYYSNMCTFQRRAKCFYYSYDDIYEAPVNIIFLDIFQHNINTITSMLDNPNGTFNVNLQMYICECINIYNKVNITYCVEKDDKDEKITRTCNSLDAFKQTYNTYLSGLKYTKYKIPSLDTEVEEYSNNCISQAEIIKSVTDSPRSEETSSYSTNDP